MPVEARDLLLADRQLLMEFRSGTREGLTRVYREYAPLLAATLARGIGFARDGQRFQLRGLSGAFELDDLLQETFMRAFAPASRARYDGVRPFRSYLVAIARNLLIDHYRKRGTLTLELRTVELRTVEQIQGPATPEEQLSDQRLRALHDTFLQSLSEQDRKLVELRFERGLSRREVGEALGLSAMRLRWRERALRRGLASTLDVTAHELGFAPKVLAVLVLIALALPVLIAGSGR